VGKKNNITGRSHLKSYLCAHFYFILRYSPDFCAHKNLQSF
jgi:hypothetical protein